MTNTVFKETKNAEEDFFDSYFNLSEKSKNRLDNSWAPVYRDEVLPLINEKRFKVLYSNAPDGRSNTSIRLIFSALVLKEMFKHTDETIIDALHFDLQYQTALDIKGPDSERSSERSLSRFRTDVAKYEIDNGVDLVKEECNALSKQFARIMGLAPTKKRMDSAMIASNIKRLSRMELIYACTNAVVKMLKKKKIQLPESLAHYLNKEDLNRIIYHERSEDIAVHYTKALEDTQTVMAIIPEEMTTEEPVQLLSRMVEEQTTTDGDGNLILKPGKEVPASAMQSPKDPTATYRKKAGKKHTGYVANFVETFDGQNALITDYDLQPNSYSDPQFAHDVLEETDKQEEAGTILTDGAFGSQEIRDIAKEKNIDFLTSGLLSTRFIHEHDEDFVLDETGKKVLGCPAGHVPTSVTYNENNNKISAKFPLETCKACPLQETCRVKFQKKSAVVQVTKTVVETAKQQKLLETEEYQDLVKQRNGVEGIPSLLRRKFHVDTIPVRGLVRLKSWIGFKFESINVKRLIDWRQNQEKVALE